MYVLSKLVIIVSSMEEQEISVSHDQGLHESSSRTHVSSDLVYLERLYCSTLAMLVVIWCILRDITALLQDEESILQLERT